MIFPLSSAENPSVIVKRNSQRVYHEPGGVLVQQLQSSKESNTMETRGSGSIDWRAASWAGMAYTAGVFAFAFAVGTIRVTLVAPRLGTLLAVVLEAPIVLAVSWRVSSWCTRRFNVSRDSRARILMGAVAFSILMLLEMGFSVLVFGATIDRYLAKYASTAGVIGLAMQVCFATLPWVQCHLVSRTTWIKRSESREKPR